MNKRIVIKDESDFTPELAMLDFCKYVKKLDECGIGGFSAAWVSMMFENGLEIQYNFRQARMLAIINNVATELGGDEDAIECIRQHVKNDEMVAILAVIVINTYRGTIVVRDNRDCRVVSIEITNTQATDGVYVSPKEKFLSWAKTLMDSSDPIADFYEWYFKFA
mgnify:CR=1 FL=1